MWNNIQRLCVGSVRLPVRIQGYLEVMPAAREEWEGELFTALVEESGDRGLFGSWFWCPSWDLICRLRPQSLSQIRGQPHKQACLSPTRGHFKEELLLEGWKHHSTEMVLKHQAPRLLKGLGAEAEGSSVMAHSLPELWERKAAPCRDEREVMGGNLCYLGC